MTPNEWLIQSLKLNDFEREGKIPTEVWDFYYDSLNLFDNIPNFIHPKAVVSKFSEITGNVIIEEGAQILPYSIIQGPAYIGKNAVIGNYSFVRPKSLISQESLLGNHSYCNEAFIGPKSRVSHFCGLSRSIICKNSTLSAFVLTSTLRADYKSIKHNEDFFILKRGCIIGNNTFIAPHVTISPNIRIGDDCFIGSFLTIREDLADGKRIKLPFEPIVDENTVKVGQRVASGKILFNENGL